MSDNSLKSTPIGPSDRVHQVLLRDERLVEVFAAASNAFEKLRKPALRRTMARLVTVEQAARIAKVDASSLLHQLNSALVEFGALEKNAITSKSVAANALTPNAVAPHAVASASGSETDTAAHAGTFEDNFAPSSKNAEAEDSNSDSATGSSSAESKRIAAQHAAWNAMVQRSAKEESPASPVPEALRQLSGEQVFEADVREDLRAGREPLGVLLKSARQVPDGGLLKVRAIFEPVPLYTVLGRQGFTPYTESFAKDDWLVWFHRDGGLHKPSQEDGHKDATTTRSSTSEKLSTSGKSSTSATASTPANPSTTGKPAGKSPPSSPDPMPPTSAAAAAAPPQGTTGIPSPKSPPSSSEEVSQASAQGQSNPAAHKSLKASLDGAQADGADSEQRSPVGTTRNAETEDDPALGSDAPFAADALTRVLDVRGLEPPEPMIRTLEALSELPEGGTLIQINVRVPQFLIAELQERGFVWEIREQNEELVRLFIRHGGE